ncbi:MAG: response regulator [Nitrospinae bacterium]|nr:response regulator [Nitrospinota bacterium]
MSIKLLFADDSVTIQKVVELAFESEDVEVTTVSSGDKVIEKLTESMPDIIIADVVMPGMNGIELCERLKKDENYSNIPVLLLRNEFDEFDADVLLKTGADDCITKPFKSEELVKKIKELAAKKTVLNYTLSETEGAFQESIEQAITAAEIESSQPQTTLSHDSNLQENNLGEKELGDILILKPDDEVTDETNENMESLSSVEIISHESKIEDEDLNISGLLNDEEIENLKNEIKKAEEELLISIPEEKADEELPAFRMEETTASMPTNSSSSDLNNFISELEKESVISEKIKDIVVKVTEDVFEKTLKLSVEKSMKDSIETILKDKTEKLILSLTPHLTKTIEGVVTDVVPELAESLIKREIEKIKNSEIGS